MKSNLKPHLNYLIMSFFITLILGSLNINSLTFNISEIEFHFINITVWFKTWVIVFLLINILISPISKLTNKL